jgi:RecB family exonuclease
MKYFLKEVAKNIYKKYGNSVSDLTIVFPNRRSGLFFRKYLAELIEKPVWSPSIITISDLMQQLSGLQKADPLGLVFDLYDIFRKEKKSTESFDEFYLWGEMLIRDFDDIDKNLVEASDIFRNLAELKSIEDHFSYLSEDQIKAIRQFWDTLNLASPSGEQKDFMSVWQILYTVYKKLNEDLLKQNLGYEGAVYRKAIQNAKSGKLEFNSHHIFVGFNAITLAEKQLFRQLSNKNMASFYWDYDEFFIKQGHEAGLFIRKNIEEFPGEKLDMPPAYKFEEPIKIVDASYDIAEAKSLQLLLSSNALTQNEPDKTAVVLPDERMLLPALSALPDEQTKVNITMGYPVAVTPAYSFLQALLSLQNNARKEGEFITFYYKDVLAILNHQYLGALKDTSADEKIEEIRKRNKIFIREDELKFHPLFKHIFVYVPESARISDYLLKNYHSFYSQLKKMVDDEDQPLQLELESIYQVYISVKRIREIFSQRSTEVKRETYWRILERILGNQSISFKGEPLAGLQIMGLLETRALDFEELVVLSMNEGIFPKSDQASSFIPYNLRKGFNLPTFEHNDAIYAYYFYRLIQRAKRVTLVYNSTASGVKTGEMSRFLYQIKHGSSLPVKEETIISDIRIPAGNPIKVEKTEAVLNHLKKYDSLTGDGEKLSPSALQKYLRCSLQFYYRYVAEIKEPEEIDENVDLPLFGNILHRALEYIYTPFIGKEVNSEKLKNIIGDKKNIEDAILKAYQKEYFKKDPERDEYTSLSGENILVSEIIFNYILQMLKVDQKFAPFTIHSLEKPYHTDVDFRVNGEDLRVTFRGYIDRLDEKENGIRVIDYKTGKADNSFKDIPCLFEKEGNHAALQALLYARMYVSKSGAGKTVIPGLYFLKTIYQKNFQYVIGKKDAPLVYQDYARELDENLKAKLEEIFDREKPFQQTDDRNICRSCPYAKLCRRN